MQKPDIGLNTLIDTPRKTKEFTFLILCLQIFCTIDRKQFDVNSGKEKRKKGIGHGSADPNSVSVYPQGPALQIICCYGV